MSFPAKLPIIALVLAVAAPANAPGSGATRKAAAGRRIPVEKITRLKDPHLTTLLCREGEARAVIAVAEGDAHRALAEKINACLKDCGGTELPVLTSASPEELLPRTNVIALGCLADNPFIEKLYFRWLCFTDRWYPGEGGYEVRSVHDPLGTGTNVILLGGSDTAGVAESVKRFCALLGPASSGAVSVGWLLGVSLGKNLEPPSDAKQTPPLLRLFVEEREMPLGYNEASRLGLMYYYSGQPRYARAFIEAARRTRLYARANHYYAHHNALVWDLIEESPVFSDDDRLFIANEILEHALGGEAGGGLAALGGGPEAIFDRHAGFIGLSALTDIRYLARDYPRPDWQPILSAVDGYFRPRLGSFASGSDLARGIYTYLEALVIYSLLTGNDELVRSGALRAWAGRCAAMCDPLGFLVPSGQFGPDSYPYFTLRKAAYLLKDPGFLYLAEARRRAGELQDVYELGMEYDQGQAFAGDLEPRPPRELTGVHVVPLDDWERRQFDPRVPAEKAFSKLTFRSGFGEDDQYLVLDGIWGGPPGKPIQDANSILQYSDGARTFLVTADPETQNRRSSYVNHNLLSVTRDGQAPEPPRLASLEAVADLPSIGYAHTRLDPYLDGSWDRRILWRKGAYFIVIDAFRAGLTGTFALESQWRLLGRTEISASGFRSTLGGDRTDPQAGRPQSDFPLRGERESAGDRTIVFETAGFAGAGGSRSAWLLRTSHIDIAADAAWRQYAAYAPPVISRVRPAAVLELETGAETGLAALFYTKSPAEAHHHAIAAAGAGSFLITGDEPAWLAVSDETGRLARGPLEVNAGLVWATNALIAGAGLTRLRVDERVLLSSEVPVDLEWDLLRGACRLSLDRPAKVEVASRGLLKLGPGEHDLTGLPVLDEEAAENLARILDPSHQPPAMAPDKALRPALDAPDLPAAPEPWPERTVLALKIDGGGETATAILGCADGRVVRSDSKGEARWEFKTGGPVQAVETAWLRPGVRAVLAGSDDEFLYALDFETGRKLWDHRAEVYPETSIYPWWTLDGRAKVRSVLAADFDGDGRAEIAIGTGGMQVELVDAAGVLKWRQPVRYGLPVRLLALRPPSGSSPELFAGLDFLASQAGVFRFTGEGALKTSDAFPSGREGWDYTGVSAWAVFDPPGSEGPLLAVGRSGAFNEIEFFKLADGRSLGKARTGDTVSGMAWTVADGEALCVAGTEAGWLMAVRPDGNAVWAVPLPDAVLRLWKAGDESVAAWCPGGDYYVIDRRGKVQARGRSSWAAAMLATSSP